MNKLFKVKKWFTVEEVAQRFLKSVGNEVLASDVLNLIAENKLCAHLQVYKPQPGMSFIREDLPSYVVDRSLFGENYAVFGLQVSDLALCTRKNSNVDSQAFLLPTNEKECLLVPESTDYLHPDIYSGVGEYRFLFPDNLEPHLGAGYDEDKIDTLIIDSTVRLVEVKSGLHYRVLRWFASGDTSPTTMETLFECLDVKIDMSVIRISAESVESFESENFAVKTKDEAINKIHPKTENNYLRLIKALTQGMIGDLTHVPKTDAQALQVAAELSGVELPLETQALASCLKKAYEID